VARWVSWRGWFGCPSRMRPLALPGLRVVARVSEAHPGSPLPLGERTCSRARRACPRMPLPVEMAEARAGGRKGGTGAEAVAGRSEVGVLAWVIRVSIPDAAFGLIRATCRSPGKRSAPGFPSPFWVRGHARAPPARMSSNAASRGNGRGAGGAEERDGRQGRGRRSKAGVLVQVIRVSVPDAALGLIRATCRSPGKRSAPGFPSPHPSPGREGPGAQRAGFFAVRRVDFFVAFRVGDLRAPVLAAAFFVADFFAAFFVARPVVLRAVFFAAVFFAGLLL